MKKMKCLFLIVLIMICTIGLAFADIITLKSMANGMFVCAENGGASPLIANRGAANTWEQFNRIYNSDGTISLIAQANGRYVCAENAGAGSLIANRTAVGTWEKFRQVSNGDGTISLLSMANNRYVCAENAGSSALIANRSAIGSWEKFAVNASGGGSSATPTPTPYSGGSTGGGSVSRPGECPSDLWNNMVSAASRLGMPADYARLLAAVCKHESSFGAGLAGSVSAGDGLMQVQPATRSAYSGSFSSTFGHGYNHASNSDQIAMGALILKDMIVNYCGGQYRCGCLKYNGGPNYVPGTVDAYGRPVYAEQYADNVMATYRNYGGTHS
ncbi:MAG: transglycosylase SLT domain-containing protein [Spirochaetales bacterium]|nr:transglycosylase SLT domain-containing protein [Spirochaetales bacterium]